MCNMVFFKGRSTSMNLIEFVNYSLNAMDKGLHVETLYTDFSKVFDKIDIQMLIFKLGKLGFNAQILNWIQSYLTDASK